MCPVSRYIFTTINLFHKLFMKTGVKHKLESKTYQLLDWGSATQLCM